MLFTISQRGENASVVACSEIGSTSTKASECSVKYHIENIIQTAAAAAWSRRDYRLLNIVVKILFKKIYIYIVRRKLHTNFFLMLRFILLVSGTRSRRSFITSRHIEWYGMDAAVWDLGYMPLRKRCKRTCVPPYEFALRYSDPVNVPGSCRICFLSRFAARVYRWIPNKLCICSYVMYNILFVFSIWVCLIQYEPFWFAAFLIYIKIFQFFCCFFFFFRTIQCQFICSREVLFAHTFHIESVKMCESTQNNTSREDSKSAWCAFMADFMEP